MANFKQNIKKILSETIRMTLTKDGMIIINKIIDFLNSKMVHNCLELESTKDEMNAVTVRNVVDNFFPANLKRLALAEGNRILMLYNNGLISYKPHYPDVVKRKKKTKKAIEVEAMEFNAGISVLKSLIFPEASFQDQAKTILCELLEEVAIKISDFVPLKKSDNIILEDIRAALGQVLPPELSKHALAEGARIAMLFEMGMLQAMDRKVKEDDRKPVRKRQRSQSVKTPPSSKRQRRPSARKASKKKGNRKINKKKN